MSWQEPFEKILLSGSINCYHSRHFLSKTSDSGPATKVSAFFMSGQWRLFKNWFLSSSAKHLSLTQGRVQKSSHFPGATKEIRTRRRGVTRRENCEARCSCMLWVHVSRALWLLNLASIFVPAGVCGLGKLRGRVIHHCIPGDFRGAL